MFPRATPWRWTRRNDLGMSRSQSDLEGRIVGIWGFGREGISMARTAASSGAARIEAVDDVGRLPFEEPDGIANLTVFRGSEHLVRLRGCDVVFVSPGVPWHQEFFEELRGSDVRISSAADWFMSQHGSSTIGITGTKGKSTTASFLGHLLEELGVASVVAGNIGTPAVGSVAHRRRRRRRRVVESTGRSADHVARRRRRHESL